MLQPPAHLKLYNGTTDPQSHVDALKNAMLISSDFDAMRCKTFPSTLSKVAQQQFSSLPFRSVSSFVDLTNKILNHFTANHAHRKTAGSLYGLAQGESGVPQGLHWQIQLRNNLNKEPQLKGSVICIH